MGILGESRRISLNQTWHCGHMRAPYPQRKTTLNPKAAELFLDGALQDGLVVWNPSKAWDVGAETSGPRMPLSLSKILLYQCLLGSDVFMRFTYVFLSYIYIIYIITYKYIQYNIIYRSLSLIPLIHVCRWGSSDPRRWWNKHPMFLRILGQLATFNIHFCWFCAGLFLENPAKEITSRTVSWVWIRRLMPTPLHSTIGIAATTPIHICANQMIATQPPPLKQKSPWPQFSAQESFCLVYWDCCKTNVHIATLVPKKVATSPYVAESHRRRKVPLRSATGRPTTFWRSLTFPFRSAFCGFLEFPPLIQTWTTCS